MGKLIVIGLLVVGIIFISVVAIVMSTSKGCEWSEAVWKAGEKNDEGREMGDGEGT